MTKNLSYRLPQSHDFRHHVPHASVEHPSPSNHRPDSRRLYDQYNHDESFRTTRDALVNTKVRKFFPGYGTYTGTITSYYPITDTYHMLFDDGDEEIDSYVNIQKYFEGTPEYEQAHTTALALTVSLDTAIALAATMTTHDKEPNHYKDAMKDPDRDAWKAACDLEMKKLRERNCWSVVKRADIPKGTRVMGSRWTFKYKRDETGALCKVSHRSRFVAKGFTQIKNVNNFECFAPVASFVTLRLVFALTVLPHFHVNHYDVSVAFIESVLDDDTPPVYCECAEGYEDPRE